MEDGIIDKIIHSNAIVKSKLSRQPSTTGPKKSSLRHDMADQCTDTMERVGRRLLREKQEKPL